VAETVSTFVFLASQDFADLCDYSDDLEGAIESALATSMSSNISEAVAPPVTVFMLDPTEIFRPVSEVSFIITAAVDDEGTGSLATLSEIEVAAEVLISSGTGTGTPARAILT